MHEVALSTQLARAVARAAGDAKVVAVRLKIGALRQVVPETLDYAWGFVVRGTLLDAAKLHIQWVPLEITCPAGHRSNPEELDFTCPICDETAQVTAGNEFTIIDIDVARS